MAETPFRDPLNAGGVALGVAATEITNAGGAGDWKIVRNILVTNIDTISHRVWLGFNNAVVLVDEDAILLPGITLQPGEPLNITDLYQPLAGSATTPERVVGYADEAGTVIVSVGGLKVTP